MKFLANMGRNCPHGSHFYLGSGEFIWSRVSAGQSEWSLGLSKSNDISNTLVALKVQQTSRMGTTIQVIFLPISFFSFNQGFPLVAFLLIILRVEYMGSRSSWMTCIRLSGLNRRNIKLVVSTNSISKCLACSAGRST